MNRRTLVLAIGGLVIAVFVVGAYLHSRNTKQRVAPAVSTSQSSTLVRAHSPVIGNKDAPSPSSSSSIPPARPAAPSTRS
jgi:hypothetical protein